MNSSTDPIAAIELAAKYLYEFGCSILILLGSISCIINLIVFTQKTLRQNPCSNYFIAYNLANFLYICSSLLSLTLSIVYNIDLTVYNLTVCRALLYTIVLSSCLSPFYLILASIDRVLVTSPNAATRRRSTHRLAYTCIIGGTFFWALFHSHVLIFTTITQYGPNYFVCYFQPGFYHAFIGYYWMIQEMMTFSLMILCGLWSIKNVRSINRVRPAPVAFVSRTTVAGGLYSTASKDRQLVIMLCMDSTIYSLFSFMLAVFLIYEQITQNYTKSTERIQFEDSVRNICLFSDGIPFCISCYTNVIVSKRFRSEMKKALSWKRIFCIH